jgi:hypothetical protein
MVYDDHLDGGRADIDPEKQVAHQALSLDGSLAAGSS